MIKTVEMPVYEYPEIEPVQVGVSFLAYLEENPMINAEGKTRIEAAGILAIAIEDSQETMDAIVDTSCNCKLSLEHLCPYNEEEGCAK